VSTGRKIGAVLFLTLFVLAVIDVIDFHVCNNRVCIARAGNCHICEEAP
jgi:hypothetical protein